MDFLRWYPEKNNLIHANPGIPVFVRLTFRRAIQKAVDEPLSEYG